MGAGIMMRQRRPLRGPAASAVAFLATIVILVGANLGPRLRGKIFSAIDVTVASTKKSLPAPAEAYCSIFTDAACSLDLPTPDADVVLSAIPPDETAMWMHAAITGSQGGRTRWPPEDWAPKGAKGAKDPQQSILQKDFGDTASRGLGKPQRLDHEREHDKTILGRSRHPQAKHPRRPSSGNRQTAPMALG